MTPVELYAKATFQAEYTRKIYFASVDVRKLLF